MGFCELLQWSQLKQISHFFLLIAFMKVLCQSFFKGNTGLKVFRQKNSKGQWTVGPVILLKVLCLVCDWCCNTVSWLSWERFNLKLLTDVSNWEAFWKPCLEFAAAGCHPNAWLNKSHFVRVGLKACIYCILHWRQELRQSNDTRPWLRRGDGVRVEPTGMKECKVLKQVWLMSWNRRSWHSS